MFQELEALKNQVQSHLAEINHLKSERQELLRRAEAGVKIVELKNNEIFASHIFLLKIPSMVSVSLLTQRPLGTAHQTQPWQSWKGDWQLRRLSWRN